MEKNVEKIIAIKYNKSEKLVQLLMKICKDNNIKSDIERLNYITYFLNKKRSVSDGVSKTKDKLYNYF